MVPMETDSDDIEVIKTNILITSFVHNGNNIKTYNLINLHLVITSLSKIKTYTSVNICHYLKLYTPKYYLNQINASTNYYACSVIV
jgi:hypothetical protein